MINRLSMNTLQTLTDSAIKEMLAANRLLPLLIEAEFEKRGFDLTTEHSNIIRDAFKELTWDNAQTRLKDILLSLEYSEAFVSIKAEMQGDIDVMEVAGRFLDKLPEVVEGF